MDDVLFSYRLQLVTLNETHAVFSFAILFSDEAATFEMPKRNWIDMGRPGEIVVSPELFRTTQQLEGDGGQDSGVADGEGPA